MLIKTLNLKNMLIVSFLAITAVTFMVGVFGIYYVNLLGGALYEVGVVRLPSIEGLAMMNVAQTKIRSAENMLLEKSLDGNSRRELYQHIQEAWKRADEGWRLYEPLPQTPEETILWKQFVPAWKAWKKDHEVFIMLCQEWDLKQVQNTNPSTLTSLHQKIVEQVLEINTRSFRNAENLMEKIILLNHKVAEEAKKTSVANYHDMIRVRWTMVIFSVLGVAGAAYFGVNLGVSINSRIEAIINAMPSTLVSLDKEGFVIQWNRSATLLTRIPAGRAMGKSYKEVLPNFGAWIEKSMDEIKNGASTSLEKISLVKEDRRFFYDLMVYPLISKGLSGFVLCIEDVTERTHMQEVMLQTEKMMTVGGLAAGMAHEINNPLGIITQAVQNIERRTSAEIPANQKVAEALNLPMETMREYLRQRDIPRFIHDIQEASRRAANIVSNMLQFSRKSEATLHPVDLTVLIEHVINLAANDYDLKKRYDFRSVEIHRDFASGMPPVPVIAVEIQQVLFNLLKNAVQAMDENPPERKPSLLFRVYPSPPHAVIEVADNGPGMTEEIRSHIFEPFFTTKKVGVGTGLGLSVSYTIITQNHHASLHVESSPGRGAKFIIRLPLSQKKEFEVKSISNSQFKKMD